MATFMLLKTLDELDSVQLKKFQWHLCQGGGSFEGIPRGRMEKQDRQDTVDLMVTKWPEEAVAITLEILRAMGQNNLAGRLEVQSRA
ncbi:caspase b-like isoform X2 [Hypomesus transpacificus]|uniref:caspase b-like isoform X2 n=1 Tax=Hypomesus transpacificus TaxID=137520 RepID=UPI001F074E64|nr:caspase b-like isoform X2 [Hypomesus transpacificus]